jgi:hypothetical protein
MLEKDIKALKGVSDKQYIFIQSVFVVFILFHLFITFNNISLAVDYGRALGLNFEGILGMWNAEPVLQKQYMGYEVQSLHRLNMAIISFGSVWVFIICSASLSIIRKRNKRVLAALEQCGAIKPSKNA